MAELRGKSLQQDLFVKKLWFHALKTRGKQRERELQEAGGAAESGTVEEPTRWVDTVVKDAQNSSNADESSRHCFDSPANGVKVSSPEWEPIATSFAENGVVLLKGATNEPEARLEKAASAAAFVQHRLAALRAVADDAGAGAEDHRLKTAELVRRSPGRYDLVVETDDLNDGRGAPILALREGAPWLPFVRRVLGADARLIHAGCVCSLPGSAVQGVHRDGKHLFSSGELGSSALPTHCLTVFLPLVPLTAAIGPTQFWPSTHVTFGDAPQAMAASVTFVASESCGVEGEAVAVPGDAIIFDYRILHRGLANVSDEARPLAYFTFAKPWFRDATNYTKTSLFRGDSEETFHEGSAETMTAPSISKGKLVGGNGDMVEPTETRDCPSVIIADDDDVVD